MLFRSNSAGPWNTTPLTPRDRMLTHESGRAEFAKIRAIGVAGVKVDFFAGDGQSTMVADVYRLNDVRARFGLQLTLVGAVGLLLQMSPGYDSLLRILRMS